MDLAVAAALELTTTEDTLIIVTADHSHTMTINGYPERGNNLLGNMHDKQYNRNHPGNRRLRKTYAPMIIKFTRYLNKF